MTYDDAKETVAMVALAFTPTLALRVSTERDFVSVSRQRGSGQNAHTTVVVLTAHNTVPAGMSLIVRHLYRHSPDKRNTAATLVCAGNAPDIALVIYTLLGLAG